MEIDKKNEISWKAVAAALLMTGTVAVAAPPELQVKETKCPERLLVRDAPDLRLGRIESELSALRRELAPLLKQVRTEDHESRLTAWLDAGEGGLLWRAKGDYFYPVQVESRNLLESFPPKLRVKGYNGGKAIVVSIVDLRLSGELDGTPVQLQEESREWVIVSRYVIAGDIVLAPGAEPGRWRELPLAKIRFMSGRGEGKAQ